MKLYSHPGSYSSAAHMALIESKQDFELMKFNLFGDRILADGRNYNNIKAAMS